MEQVTCCRQTDGWMLRDSAACLLSSTERPDGERGNEAALSAAGARLSHPRLPEPHSGESAAAVKTLSRPAEDNESSKPFSVSFKSRSSQQLWKLFKREKETPSEDSSTLSLQNLLQWTGKEHPDCSLLLGTERALRSVLSRCHVILEQDVRWDEGEAAGQRSGLNLRMLLLNSDVSLQ